MHQFRVLLRNAKLGVGAGQLFKISIIVGFVKNEMAELVVFFVAELILEEGREPSVPWHHRLFGAGRGGGFGRGCADVGAADGLGGDVGDLVFDLAIAKDEGGADHGVGERGEVIKGGVLL